MRVGWWPLEKPLGLLLQHEEGGKPRGENNNFIVIIQIILLIIRVSEGRRRTQWILVRGCIISFFGALE